MKVSAHNFINQWVQLTGSWNWQDWTLIELSFENDIALGGFEFMFIVLGFGYRVRFQHKPLFSTEKGKQLKKSIDEINNE